MARFRVISKLSLCKEALEGPWLGTRAWGTVQSSERRVAEEQGTRPTTAIIKGRVSRNLLAPF
jgi:hypothetical protein